jgi:UDP-N-acetylmuramoyl-L-alanyl-D-glutamate--2,6-diaminopimelate ligase
LAVLNRDDRSFEYLSELVRGLPGVRSRVRVLDYGLQSDSTVRAEGIRQDGSGLHFIAAGPDFRFPVDCALVGDFNVSNILAAVSATVGGLGISAEAARAGIAALPGVPGRMERIDLGQDFLAIVDFAHTPNALRVALGTARQLAGKGRVIAVFGSAGLRDRQKRRMMAETSAQQADLTVLTAEDPRTESLDGILAEMADGAQGQGGVEGKTFWRVPDRGEALRFALRLARPGDVVIACGKGHEQSMCFETTEYPWDDRTALRAALAEKLGVSGPEMPYLPTADRSTNLR